MPELRNSSRRSRTSPGSSSLARTCCNWGYGGHGTEDFSLTPPHPQGRLWVGCGPHGPGRAACFLFNRTFGSVAIGPPSSRAPVTKFFFRVVLQDGSLREYESLRGMRHGSAFDAFKATLDGGSRRHRNPRGATERPRYHQAGRSSVLAIFHRYCREMPALPPRSTNFCTLPVAVFGSSSTKLTHCGVLKWARLLRA
jgi:hypothetical protein